MEESPPASKIALNMKELRKQMPAIKSRWKYENEPRVLFMAHIARCPKYEFGKRVLIGIPESLVGNSKMEHGWIQDELGGKSVRVRMWRPWVLPELRRKRLLHG